MVVYDLICSSEHEFESWFQDSTAYDRLRKARKVVCPICGDARISKSLMAPAVTGAKKKGETHKAVSSEAAQQMGQYMAAVREMRQQVEKNCDYVGDRFPEEARRIHYGETGKRNIYGEATSADADALSEEGIDFQRIPWTPDPDA